MAHRRLLPVALHWGWGMVWGCHHCYQPTHSTLHCTLPGLQQWGGAAPECPPQEQGWNITSQTTGGSCMWCFVRGKESVDVAGNVLLSFFIFFSAGIWKDMLGRWRMYHQFRKSFAKEPLPCTQWQEIKRQTEMWSVCLMNLENCGEKTVLEGTILVTLLTLFDIENISCLFNGRAWKLDSFDYCRRQCENHKYRKLMRGCSEEFRVVGHVLGK